MLKSRSGRLKVTRWMDVEPVGADTKRFIRFALEEAKKAKRWVWEYLAENTVSEGPPEWQAAQLRRRYLAGKPVLHTIPGSIFQAAILEALYTADASNEKRMEGWESIFLPLREGWTGERGTDSPVAQKFSFSGAPRTVVRGNLDSRVITPEKAEAELFQERELHWKWGALSIRADVEKSVRSALQSWHIPWRGTEEFFRLVKGIEVRKVSERDTDTWEKWQLRFILK